MKIRNSSITQRLVLLVLIGAVLILFALSIIAKGIFENVIGGELRGIVLQNVERIVDESDGQLSLEKIQQITHELDFPVGYRGPEGIWQSDESLAGWHLRRMKRLFGHKDRSHGKNHHHHGPERFGLPRGYRFSRTTHNEHFVFGINDNRATVVLFVHSGTSLTQFWHYLLLALGLIISITLVIIWGVRRITRPIKELNVAVQAIGGGDFSKRVNWSRKDELGDLGRSVDDMAQHIESMLDAKRDLLLAIAHEIKTPLTRAKLIASMDSNNEIESELDEINRVLDQLLEGERMTKGHRALLRGRVYLARELDALMAQIGGRWEAQLAEDMVIDGDRQRLVVALRNILENARKYGGEETIRVRLYRTNATVQIEVIDGGVGVDEKELNVLSEAFTRLETSRARQSGGLGLGLYLTRRIIEAHGGTICFTNAVNAGLAVQIEIPMTITV